MEESVGFEHADCAVQLECYQLFGWVGVAGCEAVVEGGLGEG